MVSRPVGSSAPIASLGRSVRVRARRWLADLRDGQLSADAPPARWLRRVPEELPDGAIDCIFAANEHGAYCVPRSSRHRPAPRMVLRGRVWEPRTLDLLRASRPTGDIVHAGTYFGDFLPALCRSRRSGAVVWAFEPNRVSHRCAQITVLLNDLANCSLSQAGLGGERGSALLATADRQGAALGGGSHLARDPAAVGGPMQEEVPIVTIDESVPAGREVAAIHLDVEGNEQAALTGALSTIRRCRPLLILESVPEEGWLTANLGPLGYVVAERIEENTVLRVA